MHLIFIMLLSFFYFFIHLGLILMSVFIRLPIQLKVSSLLCDESHSSLSRYTVGPIIRTGLGYNKNILGWLRAERWRTKLKYSVGSKKSNFKPIYINHQYNILNSSQNSFSYHNHWLVICVVVISLFKIN